jgi:DNA-binding GntR family transcriptional regulator
MSGSGSVSEKLVKPPFFGSPRYRFSRSDANMSPFEKLNTSEVLSRGALRHQVVHHLLTAIFLGDLPSGTRLIVMKLAAQFGLSSTPIREALVELEAVGIIRFEHNRGAVVKPFGPDQLHEIYQLRRILEAEAARTACGRIEKKELETLRDELKKLLKTKQDRRWADQEMISDRRLHSIIITSCGSERLAEEVHRYDTLVQTLREIVGYNRQAQLEATEDHLAIVEGLLAGNGEAAAAAMSRHIDHAEKPVTTVLFSKKR